VRIWESGNNHGKDKRNKVGIFNIIPEICLTVDVESTSVEYVARALMTMLTLPKKHTEPELL
jgi:hypothetical protein